jgi:hypothetical protein
MSMDIVEGKWTIMNMNERIWKIWTFVGTCEVSDQVQDKISNQMFKNDVLKWPKSFWVKIKANK